MALPVEVACSDGAHAAWKGENAGVHIVDGATEHADSRPRTLNYTKITYAPADYADHCCKLLQYAACCVTCIHVNAARDLSSKFPCVRCLFVTFVTKKLCFDKVVLECKC